MAAAQALAAKGKWAEAKAAFRAVRLDPASSPEEKAESQAGEACVLYDAGKYTNALTELRDVLNNPAFTNRTSRALCQMKIGWSLFFARGVEGTEEAVAAFREVPETHRATALNAIARCYMVKGAYEKAFAVSDEGLRLTRSNSWGMAASFASMKGDSAGRLGKWKDAVEADIAAAELNPGSSLTLGALADAVAAAHDERLETEICKRLRSCIIQRVVDPQTCEPVQTALVRILVANGDFAEAAFEGKVLVDTCKPENLGKAVDLLSMALKGLDGSVARVNKFLEYQKQGAAGPDGKPGTPDDLTDPLVSLESPSKAERDRLFSEAMATLPKTWEGRLSRATLNRYWGRPGDALRELKIAFALCPVEKDTLQKVVDRITEVLVQVSGDRTAGEKFVEFQKFGVAGPDGNPGTPDDLTNPLDKYAAAPAK